MKFQAVFAAVILLLGHSPALAQWQENGVPVSQVTGAEQDCEIISDGAGGSIIVWQTNYNSSPDIYAQRLDGDGYALWTAGGVPVCTAAEGQYKPQMVSDGAGGAIIAWSDFRAGNADIYAQRIGPDGAALWAADGIAVCTETNSYPWYPWSRISMIERQDGAFLVWYDDRSGDYDIYAQRVDKTGAILWAQGGITVCAASGDQSYYVVAVPDDAGGVIASWIDQRNGDRDIYAQRIAADSTLQWAPGGVPICTDAGEQGDHDAIPDGAGGIICVWQHGTEGGAEEDSDIYTQRIDSNGLPVWAAGGIPVCTAPNAQLWPRIASDGKEGAFYTWADRRDAVWYEHAIYVQHFSAGGDSLWPADGISIREYGGGWDPLMPEIAPDGFGGAIIAFFTGEPLPGAGVPQAAEAAEDIESIFIQRIAGDGTVWWQDGGVPLCDTPALDAPRGHRILPDGTGGAVVSWYYHFAPYGIHAQRVNGIGSTPPTGSRLPVAGLEGRIYPNPFNPSTTVLFSIPEPGHVDVRIYDTTGRPVRTLLSGRREAGSYKVTWDGADDRGAVAASGVYFCNISCRGSTCARKMIMLR